MSEFDDIAKEYGIQTDDPKLNVTNTGTGGAYQYPEGDFQVLVGHFHLKYKNKDGKTCEPDVPGAKPSYGMQDFIILKDPTGKFFVDNKYNLVDGEDVRAFMYKQFITLDSDSQWQNKKVYDSFFVENVPQFDVIENKDKRDFVIRLGLVKMYFGAPATLTLKPYKEKLYLNAVELSSHDISKEKLEKRKAVMEKLYKQIDTKWNEWQEERKANKKKEDSGVVEDAASPDDIIGEFDNDGLTF